MTPNILPKIPRAEKTDAATERLWKLVKFTILFSFPKACFFSCFVCWCLGLTRLFVCFFSPRLIFCNFLSFLLFYTFYFRPPLFHSCFCFLLYNIFPAPRFWFAYPLHKTHRTTPFPARVLLIDNSAKFLQTQNYFRPALSVSSSCSISISLHV